MTVTHTEYGAITHPTDLERQLFEALIFTYLGATKALAELPGTRHLAHRAIQRYVSQCMPVNEEDQ